MRRDGLKSESGDATKGFAFADAESNSEGLMSGLTEQDDGAEAPGRAMSSRIEKIIMKHVKPWVLGWAAIGISALCLRAAPSNSAPDFQEVFELLRAHIKGMDARALNQAAVEGLLQQLHPKVTLLPDPHAPCEGTNATGLRKSVALDGAFGYFQFSQVTGGAAKELRQAYDQLNASKPLKGIILDLRFACGSDYAAAAAVADLFFSAERPLADWGEGFKKSTTKAKALRGPLALLVNAKTAGAAEVLAGILRESGIGLVLGSATAGLASEFEEFKLKDGQRLRIATETVKLGNHKEIPSTGLKPDIAVPVSPANEKLFLEDAYASISLGASMAQTNAPAQDTAAVSGTNSIGRRMNEAELIRRHRENLAVDDESEAGQGTGEPRPPVLQDPVLARALDLLKGLSVIQVKLPSP